jgi:adenosine deaminase
LGITLHAGEADIGERVIEAIELGATRIGHGIQITQGLGASERMAQARAANVHFEVCPTSNLHTGAWDQLATHPLIDLEKASLHWSLQADNRLISVVSQGSECQVAHEHIGLSLQALQAGMFRAAQASFLPKSAIQKALQALVF